MPLHFLGAEIPTAPLLNVVVDRAASFFGVGSTIVIRLDWMWPENFDQFDIDHYNINVNSTSGEINLTLVCGECTSTVITLSETPSNMLVNTTFTATITAVNQCGEAGPTATASYTLGKLWNLLNELYSGYCTICVLVSKPDSLESGKVPCSYNNFFTCTYKIMNNAAVSQTTLSERKEQHLAQSI